uniref:Fucosyltransferase n=1 Tax=Plectus sambesii TaxID=2011161 RepID=A0A914X2A6_9BILA
MRVTLRKTFLFLYLLLCLMFMALNLFGKISPTNDETDSNDYSTTTYKYMILNFFKRAASHKRQLALFPEDSQKTDRILEQLLYVPDRLAWHPVKIYLPQGANGVSLGVKEFQDQNCRVKNCFITTDRADAAVANVVFYRNSMSPMSERRPGQLWILQLLENPEYTGALPHANRAINYTATYRWDSDLVTPYERWTPLADVPSDQRLLPSSPKLRRKSNYAAGKSKLVAWFVSHCQTSNNRLGFAKELSKHISVDIYGSCGSQSCDRLSDTCWKRLDEDYKFYLAFENSNCQDYVTEKFFVNGLQYDVIPIVMGPPRTFYEKISPPHSFIHINDFKSPEELATYLHYLNKNDSAFNAYFAWKGSGQFINTKFWCRLCALVQNPKPKVAENLDNWWKRSDICNNAQTWT